MNSPILSESKTVLVTRTAIGLTVLAYLWRLLLALAVGSGALYWLLYPHAPILSLVLMAVFWTLGISDSIRLILKNRAGLCFDGDSLQLNGYCGASFRLDGLKRKDFILVQDPLERRRNTGRLLIRKQGIYLRCVKNFDAVIAHVAAYMPEDD